MNTAPTGLPPFASLLKSRDVEDPVNLWLHRPLAYWLVAAIHRTPITPNQLTLLAMLCGFATGAMWFVGTPTLMWVGSVLLWSSSILDGADGILARAKQMHSELGRALDGSADMLVAAVTVAAAFYHIWALHHMPWHLPFMALALATAVMQIYLYDFYKECYLDSTNPEWDGTTGGIAEVQARLERARAEGASLVTRFAWSSFVGMLTGQTALRNLTNPRGGRAGLKFPVSDETIRIHRRHNYWPMQLWALVSLCPHTYIMATCGLFNRLDLYLWFRVVPGNAIFLAAIVWQRIATAGTLRELEAARLAPRPVSADPAPRP